MLDSVQRIDVYWFRNSSHVKIGKRKLPHRAVNYVCLKLYIPLTISILQLYLALPKTRILVIVVFDWKS